MFTTGKTWSPHSGTARNRYGGMAGMGDWSAADQDDADSLIFGPATSSTSGDGNFQSSQSFWVSSLPGLAEKALALKQAYDVGEINKDRIAKGLPPLTATQMQSLGPRVNVGLTAGTQNTALIVVGVIAGALVLSSLAKRR